MTPFLIPDDKLTIILAVVIPIVVLAVFAGVFGWWMWRRNKDKTMANKGDYIKFYNFYNNFVRALCAQCAKQAVHAKFSEGSRTNPYIYNACCNFKLFHTNSFHYWKHLCIVNVWGCTDIPPKFNSLNS